jgi:OOP family OmpA-OmpF porin
MKYLLLVLSLFVVSVVFAKPEAGLSLGQYSGSVVVSHHVNEYIAVDFLTSINSREVPENWGVEKIVGENSVTIYNVPESSVSSTLKVFRSIENELTNKGVKKVLSCSANQEGCGFYFPRRLALTEARKSYYDEMIGFWNYNAGDFHMYTGTLVKENHKFYVSVVVAYSSAVKSIQYSVDIVKAGEVALDAMPLTIEKISKSIKDTGKVTLDGLFFETGKVQIKDSSKVSLLAIGQYLKANPSQKYQVVGHTDSVGGTQFNLDLSQARAEAVIAELNSSFGVSLATLNAVGKGMVVPLASNETAAGRGLNRRVELELISSVELVE